MDSHVFIVFRCRPIGCPAAQQLPVSQENSAIGRAAKLGRRGDQGIKNGRQIEGRAAYGFQDLRCRRLLTESFA